MVALAELMDECYKKVPKNISKNNRTGFMYVTKFKDKSYTNGYGWRYNKCTNGKSFTCSSTSLRILREKVREKDYPWVISDSQKARESVESENIDWNQFLEMGEVIFI